ncbi:MAG: hypothetical protein SNJ77_12240 [Cytophagales bacterium]
MSTFSKEEVLRLNSLEGKSIKNVIYHKWANYSKPNQVYFCVDFIEFMFNDSEKLVFSGKEHDEIKIIELDLEQEKSMLEKEFGGKIKIESDNQNHLEPWGSLPNKTISYIALRKNENNQYFNDALIINFEGEEVLLFNNGEGLVAEMMDDDDSEEELGI